MPHELASLGRWKMSPIRAENRSRYPADWLEIRASILARAGAQCEWCGVANYSLVWRGVRADTPVRVVLTIAHLNHRPEDNGDDNLAALCQRCHNRYDGPARRAGIRARRHAGQGILALERR